MSVSLAPPMFLQFLNPNNSRSPAVAYQLFTYIAGTTTKQATWTDSTQTVENANPLELDGNGVGNFWGDPTLAYKFVWAPANDTDPPTSPIRTVDNLYFPIDIGALTQTFLGEILYPITAAEIAAGVTPVNYAYAPGHVLRYGTNTTPGTTDMTTALNNSILAVGNGGTVIWPVGTYLTSGPILAENLTGLTIQAASGINGNAGTVLLGTHTGKAILSLVGSNAVTVGPVSLTGSATTKPKTGLLLGRSSASTAGNHNFFGTSIYGSFTVAGLYNIASESNSFFGINILTSAAPIAGVYMSQADTQSVGGLTSSSMEDNKFFGGTIFNNDTAAGSAAVYIDAGVATGHIHFYGTFLLKNGADSWIYIRLGAIDGQGTIFPIGFHDCAGESATNQPNYGVHVHNSTVINPLAVTSLTLKVRLQTPATNYLFCDGSGHVQFLSSDISTPMLTSRTLTSILGFVDYSTLNLQSENAVTIAEATTSTITTLGSVTITTNTGGNTLIGGASSGSTTTVTLPQAGINGASPPAQITGWGAPTGNAVVANFPGGGPATLAQCSTAIAEDYRGAEEFRIVWLMKLLPDMVLPFGPMTPDRPDQKQPHSAQGADAQDPFVDGPNSTNEYAERAVPDRNGHAEALLCPIAHPSRDQ